MKRVTAPTFAPAPRTAQNRSASRSGARSTTSPSARSTSRTARPVARSPDERIGAIDRADALAAKAQRLAGREAVSRTQLRLLLERVFAGKLADRELGSDDYDRLVDATLRLLWLDAEETFKSEKDRDEYLVHPDHKKFGQLLHPVLADAFVIDFWAKD